MLDHYMKLILREFISENWDTFLQFCKHNDADAEEVYRALGGKPE